MRSKTVHLVKKGPDVGIFSWVMWELGEVMMFLQSLMLPLVQTLWCCDEEWNAEEEVYLSQATIP